jgi:hypothetical protein
MTFAQSFDPAYNHSRSTLAGWRASFLAKLVMNLR